MISITSVEFEDPTVHSDPESVAASFRVETRIIVTEDVAAGSGNFHSRPADCDVIALERRLTGPTIAGNNPLYFPLGLDRFVRACMMAKKSEGPMETTKALRDVKTMSLAEIAEELERRLKAINDARNPDWNPPRVEVVKASMIVNHEPDGIRTKLSRVEAVRFLEITAESEENANA